MKIRHKLITVLLGTAAATAVLTVLKHRENLKRLATGKERRLGEK